MKKRKIKRKKEKKRELQELLGLKKNNLPLFVVLERNSQIEKILEGFLDLPLQIAIFSRKKITKKINKAAQENKNVSFCNYLEKNLSEESIIAAANSIIIFDEEEKQINLARIHKTVPIISSKSSFSDYNPKEETGNAFLYESGSTWSLFTSIVRAVETYKLPYDWHGIVRDADALDQIDRENKKETFISPFSKIFCPKLKS